MTTRAHDVLVGTRQPYAKEFASWLSSRGHTASIGPSTVTFVDGRWIMESRRAGDAFDALWRAFELHREGHPRRPSRMQKAG